MSQSKITRLTCQKLFTVLVEEEKKSVNDEIPCCIRIIRVWTQRWLILWTLLVTLIRSWLLVYSYTYSIYLILADRHNFPAHGFCYFRCDSTLLLSVILLFSLRFDIIVFGSFVISVVIWHYLLLVIMSTVIELNMLLLLSVICCSLWVILLLLAYCCMYFAMVCLKRQK